MRPTLAVQHLNIRFEQYEKGLRRRVVQPVTDMSLEVCAGEIVALVGASGAGKSLIGNAVLGLLPPNATMGGRILFEGDELTAPRRKQLVGREISLLPQSTSYLDPLSQVGAQLRRRASLLKLPDPRSVAREALSRQSLSPSVERLYPFQLSGGMARRVLVALATMGSPRLIFADEPTPGLHPSAAREVLSALSDLAAGGTAVVLVTHDIPLALTIADRLVVCRDGVTLEQASAHDFCGDGELLRHPYSRLLWRALPENEFVTGAQPASSQLPVTV